MPLIDENKTILFVHIYKCGGSSIRALLSRLWGKMHYALGEHDFIVKYKEVMETSGKLQEYKNLYKFAFVRNPYDWLVSIFFHIVEHKDHPYHGVVSRLNFPQFIDWYIGKAITKRNLPHYGRQIDFISNEKEELEVDDIYKFENFENEVRTLMDGLGVSLNCQIPHLMKTQGRKKDWLLYYTSDDYKVVNEFFKKDFLTLGYERRAV